MLHFAMKEITRHCSSFENRTCHGSLSSRQLLIHNTVAVMQLILVMTILSTTLYSKLDQWCHLSPKGSERVRRCFTVSGVTVRRLCFPRAESSTVTAGPRHAGLSADDPLQCELRVSAPHFQLFYNKHDTKHEANSGATL